MRLLHIRTPVNLVGIMAMRDVYSIRADKDFTSPLGGYAVNLYLRGGGAITFFVIDYRREDEENGDVSLTLWFKQPPQED